MAYEKPKTTTKETGQPPVLKIRVGAVGVSVWENKSDKGTFNTATLQRTYTKDDGKTFEHTGTLRVGDIPKAILALQKAYEALVLKETEDTE